TRSGMRPDSSTAARDRSTPPASQTRNQAGLARLLEQGAQALGLRGGHAFSKAGQPIVAPAFVGAGGGGAVCQFFDKALFEHAADGAVQRSGAELYLAARASGDILHNRVAMAVAVGQRDEDVEDGAGKRQQRIGLRVRHANYTDGKYT